MNTFEPQLEKIQDESMKLWDHLESKVIGPASPEWRSFFSSYWTMDTLYEARQILQQNPSYQLWKHPKYQAKILFVDNY